MKKFLKISLLCFILVSILSFSYQVSFGAYEKTNLIKSNFETNTKSTITFQVTVHDYMISALGHDNLSGTKEILKLNKFNSRDFSCFDN